MQQIFKENRWWWNVGMQGVTSNNNNQNAKGKDGKDGTGGGADDEYEEDEEADEGEMVARAVEKNAVSEDFNWEIYYFQYFKEQNMIWT